MSTTKYHKNCGGIFHRTYDYVKSYQCQKCGFKCEAKYINQFLKVFPKYPKTTTIKGVKCEAIIYWSFYGGWHVRYENEGFTHGKIDLPDDWQDMDRTWTAQDIYWEDKYDCIIVQGRALQIKSVRHEAKGSFFL